MDTCSSTRLFNSLKPYIPRILSQLDRDPDSPTFGSFDRNYWHYKIRDFSSMILQQGMLILQVLHKYDHPENPWFGNTAVSQWIKGSLDFWGKEQLKNGSFNEYYPYESGYPPTAFSLYAVALMVRDSEMEPGNELKAHIRKAVKWLLKHPEKEALNQEAAGLAALVLASKIPGIIVNPGLLEQRLKWFYHRQTEEGWFPEYGGPDLGYLTVTLDCLWDIYAVSKDKRAFLALGKAIGFLSKMVSVSGETPVMINARNTDYLVPYGICRYAEHDPQAASLLRTLLSKADKPGHYLNRTDDRYACHYVGQSFFRTLLYLDKITPDQVPLPAETGFSHFFPEAGLQVIHLPTKTSFYIYSRKGGIINIFNKNGIQATDFGWRHPVHSGKFAVTHWLDDAYIIRQSSGEWSIEGEMTTHGWMKSSPFRHIVLRVGSRIAGNSLIPILKKLMIFGSPKSGIQFQRQITLHAEDSLTILDTFSGKAFLAERLRPAPHYSLRHVASAGLFVPEELLELPEFQPMTKNSTYTLQRKITL